MVDSSSVLYTYTYNTYRYIECACLSVQAICSVRFSRIFGEFFPCPGRGERRVDSRPFPPFRIILSIPIFSFHLFLSFSSSLYLSLNLSLSLSPSSSSSIKILISMICSIHSFPIPLLFDNERSLINIFFLFIFFIFLFSG